jgi:Protein of unknown function (DUF3631)
MTILDLTTLAHALGGEVTAGQVLAPGPGHSAADRSLSVKLDDAAPDGFVCHSFAGDDPIQCRDYIRERAGLPKFEPNGKAGNGSGRSWATISEHVYRDERGDPHLRVCRQFDGRRKQYPQSHWNGSAWVHGKPKGPKIPYRLPEIMAAPPGAPVLVVEGEKCADALAKLGFVATCNSEGADNGNGTKWTADLKKWFTGRNVVLLPDNDTPGRRHVEHVAKQLHDVAASVRILDLAEHWPHGDPMPKGDDVADWIEQHDRAGSRLAQFVKDTPSWQPLSAGGTTADPDDDAALEELAGLSPLQYSKRKKEAAKWLGVTVGDLDRLVRAKRPKLERDDEDEKPHGRGILFPVVEACAEAVDGAELLDSVSEAIGKHVVMYDHARDAAALWVVHTYLLDCFLTSPRLAVRSPMKRCGKTTLLDVLMRLVLRPLSTANVTPPAIFRVVEGYRPTLLVDEADTFLRGNDELRGVINSGHRRGGSVLRTVGEDHEPRQFSTYAACAIALIGNLPDTLHDRSVVIDLKRRLPSEQILPLRSDRTGHLDDIASQAMRWAQDNVVAVGAADPEMPAGIYNREADNWRPLLAIADVAGGHWPERARKAAAMSREVADDDDSRIVVLLGDVREIFVAQRTDRMLSADLVEALIQIEGRPWAEYGRTGKPLTQNQLARLFKPLAIVPGTLRAGSARGQGYQLHEFEEAFARYLPSEGGSQPCHRDKCDEIRTSCTFQTVTPESDVTVVKCKKSNNDGHCHGVTVETGGEGASAQNCAHEGVCRQCGRVGGELVLVATPEGPPEGVPVHRGCVDAWAASDIPDCLRRHRTPNQGCWLVAVEQAGAADENPPTIPAASRRRHAAVGGNWQDRS